MICVLGFAEIIGNLFKRILALRYMEDKTCKNCERIMTIDNFDEGRKTCKMCLANKRTSYYKHHNMYNEAQEKDIYKEDE